MNLKCCRIIKHLNSLFFVCEMNFPVLWPVPKMCDLGTWHKSMLSKGTSKDFQKFSKLSLCVYLCWWEEKIWLMSWAGTGSGALAAGVHCGGEGSCSYRTLSRALWAGAQQGKAVCPSSHHTPLWLVGCCNVGSQPKPANELQILIPFASEKDTGAKLHVYGQQKDNDLEQLWSEISKLQFSD